MDKVEASKCIFKFSKNNAPVLTVPPGSSVIIDTMDCFSDQIQTSEDRLDSIDWDRINPAAGPVYIKGALKSDVLKVTIEDIQIKSQGAMVGGEGLGPLDELMEDQKFKIIAIKDGYAVFNDLNIPVKPMIGVIGVAPLNEDFNTGTPGKHGGNMDNTMIAKGAVLYFPVFVEGALLSLGDLHAVMGDGEIGGSGVEVAGSVTVKLEIVKDLTISNPLLENEEFFSTIASSKLLDDAVKTATMDMAKLLSSRIPLSMHEISMLMSIAGHTQICQVVDPQKTARFVMPKYILEKYDFKL